MGDSKSFLLDCAASTRPDSFAGGLTSTRKCMPFLLSVCRFGFNRLALRDVERAKHFPWEVLRVLRTDCPFLPA